MIKCYFVDVKDISSDLPRSHFIESDLEQLANLILATDGLIRPLILKKSGEDTYKVIEGHREYYAVLTAREKDRSKVEMVNAFVIDENIHSSAIEQLKLLKEDHFPIVTPAPIPSGIEQLLPALSAAISQQIQPLIDQLAKQQKMLEALMIDRTSLPTVRVETIEQPDLSKLKDPSSIGPAVVVKSVKVIEPKPSKLPKADKTKLDKAPKASTSQKVAVSVESIAETNTLNIINTLSQDDLIFRMGRSGVSKAAIKLVPNIINVRDSQPDRKFDTWATIVALKIKGLGAATVKGIIDKLK